MKKSNDWIKIVGALAALAGVAVAVGVFLKNKSKKISEELDFDNSSYFEDEDMYDEDYIDSETEAVEDFTKEAEEIAKEYSYDISEDIENDDTTEI